MMKTARLDDMIKGWFVGNFSPSILQTEVVEVAVKKYPPGSKEEWHYHKIATEITVIVSGQAEINGVKYNAGDIVLICPGEGVVFKAVTFVVTTVVKVPGAANDKYLN